MEATTKLYSTIHTSTPYHSGLVVQWVSSTRRRRWSEAPPHGRRHGCCSDGHCSHLPLYNRGCGWIGCQRWRWVPNARAVTACHIYSLHLCCPPWTSALASFDFELQTPTARPFLPRAFNVQCWHANVGLAICVWRSGIVTDIFVTSKHGSNFVTPLIGVKRCHMSSSAICVFLGYVIPCFSTILSTGVVFHGHWNYCAPTEWCGTPKIWAKERDANNPQWKDYKIGRIDNRIYRKMLIHHSTMFSPSQTIPNRWQVNPKGHKAQ